MPLGVDARPHSKFEHSMVIIAAITSEKIEHSQLNSSTDHATLSDSPELSRKRAPNLLNFLNKMARFLSSERMEMKASWHAELN